MLFDDWEKRRFSAKFKHCLANVGAAADGGDDGVCCLYFLPFHSFNIILKMKSSKTITLRMCFVCMCVFLLL